MPLFARRGVRCRPAASARRASMRSMVVPFCAASFLMPSSSAARWRPV
jgi:hypothetical protein